MKKLYILILISLLFIQHNALAQMPSSSETIDPSQGAMASTWFVGKYGGTSGFDWGSPKESEKGIVKLPLVNIHTAIELSIDKATGKTTARWEDGSTFDGYTYYGQINGEGTITFADGSKYHGEWRFDRFHGVGTMEYADGSKYHGQWSFGKPDGQGTIIEPNGVKITLKFDEGIPRGKCIIQDVDGRLYTGRWSSGILREESIKPIEEKK